LSPHAEDFSRPTLKSLLSTDPKDVDHDTFNSSLSPDAMLSAALDEWEAKNADIIEEELNRAAASLGIARRRRRGNR